MSIATAPANGQTVLVPNVLPGIQLPISRGGSTLINTSSFPITLSNDGNFTSGNTIELSAGVSLPWTSSVVYASAITAPRYVAITVVPQLLNYFSPVVNPNGTQQVLDTRQYSQLLSSPAFYNVPLPNGVASIVFNATLQNFLDVPPNWTLQVVGADTGLIYCTRSGYLYTDNTFINAYTQVNWIVPITYGIDRSVNITFYCNDAGVPTGSLFQLTTYGTSEKLKESDFYGGTGNVLIGSSTVNNTVIVTGPARLLWAAIAPSSGAAIIFLNGYGVLRADNGTAGAPNNISLTFPPNTLLPVNQQLIVGVSGIVNMVSVGYCYP